MRLTGWSTASLPKHSKRSRARSTGRAVCGPRSGRSKVLRTGSVEAANNKNGGFNRSTQRPYCDVSQFSLD